MSTPPNSEEFFEKLKGQLHETASWPTEYLYKFIVKTDNKKIAKLEAIFNNMGAVESGLISRIKCRVQFDQVEANHVGFGT